MRQGGAEAIFKESVRRVVNSGSSINASNDVLQSSLRIPHTVDCLRLPDVDVDLIARPILLVHGKLL